MSSDIDIQTLKDWMTFFVAVIVAVAGVIFWVQSINDPKFEEIENKIQLLRSDIVQIRENNGEILRIVGRLEGKMENHAR
jgi:hypothetical protein